MKKQHTLTTAENNEAANKTEIRPADLYLCLKTVEKATKLILVGSQQGGKTNTMNMETCRDYVFSKHIK